MENGVGVAEGMSLKITDDELSQSKTEEEEKELPKDFQVDEVFEEALESSEDEENGGTDGLIPDSVDDGVYADASENIGSDYSGVEGNSELGDQAQRVEGFSEARNTEPEITDNEEASVAIENGNDRVEVVDERVNDQEKAGLQVEYVVDQEANTVLDDKETVEKKPVIVVEALDSQDVEKIEEDNSGTSLSDGAEATCCNGGFNHVNEGLREHDDSSNGISFEHRLEKQVQDYGSGEVEGTSASPNVELQDSNEVASWNSEINQDGHEKHEDNQTTPTPTPEHQVGDPRDEETSAYATASVDNAAKVSDTEQSTPSPASSVEEEDDVKNVTVASDSATKSATSASESVVSDREVKNDDSKNLKSFGIAEVDRQASAEGSSAVEGGKREENTQPNKEIVTPVQSAVRTYEKSSNSAAPPTRPAGLGSAAPLLGPAPRSANQPRANGQQSQVQSNVTEDTNDGEVEEGDEVRQKLQMIRVKFLRLAHRLGQTPHNVVVAQVLYRLGLAEQLRARNGGRFGAFSFDRASAMAEQLEATGQEALDFSCTIMVLGKTGVGKSATINSIFDEMKFNTDAFQMGTKKVQDVVGTVQGIKVRVIDTPGLLSSCADQRQNEKILNSVKHFIKKSPPDIVLYLDRLDMPSRDFADMPLLRTITEIFGPSIWFNAIVVLTHAASAPPEGPNGTASTYDMFVTQRSHAVQQAIRQAAGDMRLMNPVSLVENHSACRTNRAGQRVLPNGQVWKPHLLLLSFASKILAEANTLLKLQDTPPGKTFTPRSRAPPLPFLLSSLLQSKPQLKLPEEQFGGDDDAIDDELDGSSDSDDESEYDELPPFKPLTKAQLAKLSKAQKKAYYDEIEYREKVLMKKQVKEEKRRRKLMKEMAAASKDMVGEYTENVEEESAEAASVPVPMPDLSLPASFDSDNPTHRYRHLDTSNQWLVRPVLDNHGWDHDVGYEGINVERMFVVKNKTPLSFSGQVSKDKKEANLQLEVASSIKHGEGKATTLGFDMQSVGKDMAYTLRSESRFSNYRHNKATAGLSATLLGDSVSAGVKLEDKLIVNKQLKVVVSGGAMASRGDVAYGGTLEATLRDKDYPLGRFLSTLGLSIMDWHGELALGCNIQTQLPVGRSSNVIARANLNNRGSGQVSLRMNSSEHVQLALIGLIPLIRRLVGDGEHSSGQ